MVDMIEQSSSWLVMPHLLPCHQVKDDTPPPLPTEEFLATLVAAGRIKLGAGAAVTDDATTSNDAEGSGDWNPGSGVGEQRTHHLPAAACCS